MADKFEEQIPKDARAALDKLSGYFHPDDLKARRIEFNDIRQVVHLLELAQEYEPVPSDAGGMYFVEAVRHTVCEKSVWPEDHNEVSTLFDLLMVARGHECPCDHPNGYESGRCPGCGASSPDEEDDYS